MLLEARPEDVGIPSDAILKILRQLDELRLPMHSLLVLRHGKLVSENYWKPFHRDRKHRLYSVSKSWVALAVGIMQDEGKLSLDDQVVKYFPEYTLNDSKGYLKRATIRDMLMMADCHDDCTHKFEMDDWAKSWFDTAPTHPSGTIFQYNTTSTNICCGIVEKLSDMSFVDYLYPRLLEPIGASAGITCIQAPEGFSFGGSGVLATPRDLARVALVCINGGKWNGNQLISEQFVREATSWQIDNSAFATGINDGQGYGYQIWRTRHNGFAFYGMGSQYAICLPDQDLIIITTGDTQGYLHAGHIIHEMIWQELLPRLKDERLAENVIAYEALKEYSTSMELPLEVGQNTSPIAAQVSGVTYHFTDNPLNIDAVSFDIKPGEVVMTYRKPNGEHKLIFGMGKHETQEFPETHYSGKRIGDPAGRGYEVLANAAWVDDTTLVGKVMVIDDYFGSFRMIARFIGNELTILMTKNAEDFLHDYQGFAAGRAE